MKQFTNCQGHSNLQGQDRQQGVGLLSAYIFLHIS